MEQGRILKYTSIQGTKGMQLKTTLGTRQPGEKERKQAALETA